MHHKARAWAPYCKNALTLGLDLTDFGRNLFCGISLLLFFLVMEQDWLPSQKGFSIDGDKIKVKTVENLAEKPIRGKRFKSDKFFFRV
jgi:hypothetical protein